MRAVLALTLAVAGLVGCAAQHPGTHLPGSEILRHVPADTPYLLASLQPTPREVLGKILADDRQRIAEMRARFAAMDQPGVRFILPLLDELAPNLSFEGLDRLGIGTNTTAAFYGIGFMPALRIKVKDGAKVAATVQRIVDRFAGPPAKSGQHGRRWEIPGPPRTTVVIAVSGDELLAMLAPTSDLPRFLDYLYGDARPGPALTDTTRVDDLVRGYQMSAMAIGWIDFAGAFAAFATEGSLARMEAEALSGEPSKPIPAACRTEGAAFFAHFPRLVFGVDELTGTQTRVRMTLELDPELAHDLQALKVSAVGVGAPLGASLLSFGLAGDVPKLLGLVQGRARRVLAQPYTCEYLAGFTEAASKIDTELAQPIPPWVNDLRAIAVELIDLKTAGGGLGTPKVRGVAVLSAADPIRLIDLAKRFLPSLPNISIPPDGKPVKLPGGLFFIDAFVAMRGQLLGAGIGEGADLELARLMSEHPLPEQPLGALAADMDRLMAVVAEMNKLTGKEDDLMPDGLHGKASMTLTAEPRGLVLRLLHEDRR